MEEKKVDHGIKTVFSVGGGFEDVKPIDPSDKSVVGELRTKTEFEAREKPVASEGVSVYLTYSVGQPVTGTERQFKQLVCDTIVKALKGLKYGEFEIKSVNAHIPGTEEE